MRGLEHLPAGPCVLIANHGSYLDAYVLMAAIPRQFHYVAKRELLDNRWLGKPLERIGTLFVERFDVQRSADEARQVAEAARAGQSLGFFPEGTFTRMPGLREFRLGAFVAAAQAGAPVLPVTIRGTRSMLRAGSWFPRRGRLEGDRRAADPAGRRRLVGGGAVARRGPRGDSAPLRRAGRGGIRRFPQIIIRVGTAHHSLGSTHPAMAGHARPTGNYLV
ncbi:MAG: lysophospholipid acyltransferase family protein [Candidatus Competibacteraceae bacterium]